jgi:hypothetical protein
MAAKPIWTRQPEPEPEPIYEPPQRPVMQQQSAVRNAPPMNNPYLQQRPQEHHAPPQQQQYHPPPQQQYPPQQRYEDYQPPQRNYQTMEDYEPKKKRRFAVGGRLDLIVLVVTLIVAGIGAAVSGSTAYYAKMPQATVNQMVPLALVMVCVVLILQTFLIYRRRKDANE